MENIFNPSREDLINLEEKILQLRNKKAELVSSKLAIECSLSIKAEKYEKAEFGGAEYLQIKKERAVLKNEASLVEIEIKKLNEEIRYKTQLRLEVDSHVRTMEKKSSNVDEKAILKLTNLKDKYSSFSKDKTRVSSMRIMAAEIRDDLESLLNLIR